MKKRLRKNRRGLATVEFAFIAVVLIGVIFAGLEFCRVNMIRNTIENAAYEGARTGILPGATSSECDAAAQSYLDLVGIGTSTISTSPTTITQATTDVTVTVAVPMDVSNGYVLPQFFLGKTLQASITLPREG